MTFVVETQSQQTTNLETLRAALDSGTLRQARRMLNSLHPAEIGLLLESLPPAERNVVWGLVDRDDEGDVLVELNDEVRTNLISSMDDAELVALTDGMDIDDLADLIADLPETVNRQVIRSMDQQDRDRLRSVLAFPEDSAGGLMNTDTITVRPDVTLDVVLRYLRMHGQIPEKTDSLFVVNRYGEYLGVLYITRLLTDDQHCTVAEIMDSKTEAIMATMPDSEVASLFENRDLVTAAVVDDSGHLVGRITVDDVVDVIRDDADHSLMSMAGLDEEADMFAGVLPSAKRRAVWLAINLATAFLVAFVVGIFEATIDQVVILAVLMPVVMSMGGIAGSQTLTLMIRGLALGQVERSNARWFLAKESAVGVLNGFTWAIVVGVVVIIVLQQWQVGAIIAAAMVINLVVGAIAGVLIPLFLKRLEIDPALAGGVVLTTVTDVVGVGAFLGLGAIFLT